MNQEYFCIFAGGGVRGSSYIGVLKALEEMNIKISGLAGSSVGAVFSTFYALGYSKDDIEKIILDINFQTFKDVYLPFGKDFGIFKGENLLEWIKEHIEKKFYGDTYSQEGINKPVTFKDLDKDLIIIATDVSKTEFKEFSRYKTPTTEIAEAVRASISIPGFFKPVWKNESCLVDGELIKNFPLWYFSKDFLDDERRVLEFRLEGKRELKEVKNLPDFFNAIVDTSYNISTDYLIDNYSHNDKFDIVKIHTNDIRTIDFYIQEDEKQRLVQSGYDSAIKYFKYDVIEKKKDLITVYKKLSQLMMAFRKSANGISNRDAQIAFGNLYIYLSDNKHKVHQNIYKNIEKLKKKYQENLISIDIINFNILRGRKELVKNVKIIEHQINTQLDDLSMYVNEVDK